MSSEKAERKKGIKEKLNADSFWTNVIQISSDKNLDAEQKVNKVKESADRHNATDGEVRRAITMVEETSKITKKQVVSIASGAAVAVSTVLVRAIIRRNSTDEQDGE